MTRFSVLCCKLQWICHVEHLSYTQRLILNCNFMWPTHQLCFSKANIFITENLPEVRSVVSVNCLRDYHRIISEEAIVGRIMSFDNHMGKLEACYFKINVDIARFVEVCVFDIRERIRTERFSFGKLHLSHTDLFARLSSIRNQSNWNFLQTLRNSQKEALLSF